MSKCRCISEIEEKESAVEEESFAMTLVKDNAKNAKRLFIALVVSNIIWAAIFGGYVFVDKYVDSLYETVDYQQDGEGLNNINFGEQGDVYYGPES